MSDIPIIIIIVIIIIIIIIIIHMNSSIFSILCPSSASHVVGFQRRAGRHTPSATPRGRIGLNDQERWGRIPKM